jgi:lysyl-tRNA synthetase class II
MMAGYFLLSSEVICVWQSVVRDLILSLFISILSRDLWQPSFSIAFEDDTSPTCTNEKSRIFSEHSSISVYVPYLAL